MIEWSRILGFQWDAGNERKSVDKHDVTKWEAEQVFFNEPLLILPDDAHSQSEDRFHALGMTHDLRLLHISFTLREKETLIRVISARPMHRKEKNFYVKAQKEPPGVQDGS